MHVFSAWFYAPEKAARGSTVCNLLVIINNSPTPGNSDGTNPGAQAESRCKQLPPGLPGGDVGTWNCLMR